MTIERLASEALALSEAFAADLRADWRDCLERFADAARTYAEFQLSLNRHQVAFVTLGAGERHLAATAAHLRRMGVDDAAQAVVADLCRAAPDATFGVKTSLGGTPAAQVYLKRPLPVAQVLDWLGRHGTGAAQQRRLAHVSAVLDRPYTHFLGVGLAPDAPPSFDLYFTQHVDDEGAVRRRVAQLWDPLEIPVAQREQFEAHHPALARPGRTLWVSAGVTAGAVRPALKLDYPGVALDDARRVAEAAGLGDDTLQRLARLRATLGLRRVSYLGWRLQEHPTVALYLTRRSRSVPAGVTRGTTTRP